MNFDKWWDKDIIIRDSLGHTFTRRKIVETIRDKEDAHVDSDERLEEPYKGLAYQGTLGVTQKESTPYTLDQNPTRVALRQIAHEVLRTFRPDMKNIFTQSNGSLIAPYPIIELYRYKQHSKKPKKITTKSFKLDRVVRPAKEPKDKAYTKAVHPNASAGSAFTILQKAGEWIVPRILIGNLNNIEIPDVIGQFMSVGAPAWEPGPVGIIVRIRQGGGGTIDQSFVDAGDGVIPSRIPAAGLEVTMTVSKGGADGS